MRTKVMLQTVRGLLGIPATSLPREGTRALGSGGLPKGHSGDGGRQGWEQLAQRRCSQPPTTKKPSTSLIIPNLYSFKKALFHTYCVLRMESGAWGFSGMRQTSASPGVEIPIRETASAKQISEATRDLLAVVSALQETDTVT